MPELPEVETIKRGLQKTILGLKITDVKVLNQKNFIGNPKEIIGGKIQLVERLAKIIIISIKSRQTAIYQLLIHLKMTGQLIYRDRDKKEKIKDGIIDSKTSRYDVEELPNKYTRVIISFNNNGKLYFNDLRKFGWMKLIKLKTQNLKLKADLQKFIGFKLGPEPLDKEFTLDYLKQILRKWGRPVKLLLMDQSKIAGMGNIYANEALFCSGIAPQNRGRDLLENHPEKIKKLYDCIIKVIKQGINYGGTTASDDAFRNINGRKGKMQEQLLVYGRAKKKCFKCGGVIKKIKLGGRGTFYCPVCQH